MVEVLLATHLHELVEGRPERQHSVQAVAGSWADFVRDLSLRHPRLSARIFSAEGGLAPGFVLVLNDEVVHGKLHELHLQSSDEVCILVTIAGGCDY